MNKKSVLSAHLFTLIFVGILIFTSFAHPTAGRASTTTNDPSENSELPLARFGLVGNPNFSVNLLSPDMQLWYNRLWAAINNPNAYPNPNTAATSGDLYAMGRTLHAHIMALIAAFRATGDLKLVGEIDRLMELTKGQLKDWNGDGFVSWRWLYDPSSAYYGKDNHDMDEILTHSMVAEAAYVLKANAQYNATWGQHAQFWTNYLVNTWLVKWQTWGGIDKNLTHPYTALMKFYYYMYKLTGNTAYYNEAARRAGVLGNMMVEKQGSRGVQFIWDHRVPNMGDPSWGCAPTVYSVLTVMSMQDLALEGFGNWGSDSYMAHYAGTFRDNVIKYGTTQLAGTICGGDGGTYQYEEIGKYVNGAAPGLAAWDSTGVLQSFNVQAYNAIEGSTPKRIYIPAYMLQTLAAKYASAPPAPTNTPLPSVPPSTPGTLPAGTFQETNSNLAYSGTWYSYPTSNASGGSVKYSNDPNAKIRFQINGTDLTIYRTLYSNRGPMNVCIDSQPCVQVNNYSSTVAWAVPKTFSGLGSGIHTVEIRNASTAYIDLDAVQVATSSSTTMALPAGTFQETNPNLTYSGTWYNYPTSSANGGSVKYSNDPNAKIRFQITGQSFAIYRTLYSNRGPMNVCIDSQPCVQVNNYSATVAWNSPKAFNGLSSGTHTVEIRNASTAYIDLDALQVSSSTTALSDTMQALSAEAVVSLPTETALPQPTATALPTETATVPPTETATALPTETAAPQLPAGQSGLKGEYYNDVQFGSLALTRIDPSVNFDWGYSSPDPAVGKDNFSIRWTGQVVPLTSETYTFYTQSDDGVRLWVNDQLLIDNWTGHAVAEDQGQISLTAGQPATIRLEFYEGNSHAVIKLLWSSTSQVKEVIPQSQLSQPTATSPAAPAAPAPTDVPTVETQPATTTTETVPTATDVPAVETQPAVSQPASTSAAPSSTATQLIEAETVQTTGTWTPYDSQLASGGRYSFSSGAANDALTLPFFGTSVDVVYIQHPALGSFVLELDGAVLQTVNSAASDAAFGVRASISGLTAAPHTLRVVAISGTIAIDAFYVEPQTAQPIVAPTQSAPAEQPTQPMVEQPTQAVPPTDVPQPTATPLPITIPYTDAFEASPAWTLNGLWRTDTMAGYSGTALFADATQRGQSGILEFGPAILLGTAANPMLSFWQKSSLTSGDLLAVDISLDNGQTWIVIDQQAGVVADWNAHQIDLTPYRGQTIRLRLRLDTTGVVPQGAVSIGFWMDNLSIQDVPPVPTATPFVPTLAPVVMPTLAPVMPTTDPALAAPVVAPTTVPATDPALAAPTVVAQTVDPASVAPTTDPALTAVDPAATAVPAQ